MQLIHLSDWHLGVPSNNENAFDLVGHIVKNQNPQDSAIVVSGDVMDTPNEENAILAAQLFGALKDAGFMVYAIPGNHDLYDHGVDVGFWIDAQYELWNEFILPTLGWDYERNGLRRGWFAGVQIIGLDTQCATASDGEVDLAQGAVGSSQLVELALLLQDSPSIVVGHHRAHWRDPAHLLEDADALRDVLAHRAWGYLCGHQHRADHVFDRCHYIASRRSTQPESGRLIYNIIEMSAQLSTVSVRV